MSPPGLTGFKPCNVVERMAATMAAAISGVVLAGVLLVPLLYGTALLPKAVPGLRAVSSNSNVTCRVPSESLNV